MRGLPERRCATMDVWNVRMMDGLLHHHVEAEISCKPLVPLLLCSNLADLF